MKRLGINAGLIISCLFIIVNYSFAEEGKEPIQKAPVGSLEKAKAPQAEQSKPPAGEGDGKYGIGFQWSYPAWGLSGKIALTGEISIQAVVSPFSIIARGLYAFQKEENFNLYGYGAAGTTTTSYRFSDIDYEPTFGIGAGIETNWQNLNADLPPLMWNAEVGFNYPFWISLGFGVHFPFDL